MSSSTVKFYSFHVEQYEELKNFVLLACERIEHFFPSFTLLTLRLGYLFTESLLRENEQKILNKMLPRKEKNQKETSSIYPEGKSLLVALSW